MSFPVYVTTEINPNRPAQIHGWRDFPQIPDIAAANWLRIGISPEMSAAEPPAGDMFAKIDITVIDPADPRSWFWEHAALPLCAALGVPDSGLWMRPSAAAAIAEHPSRDDSADWLLAGLTESKLRHAGCGTEDLTRCEFRGRSPLTGPRAPRPEADRLRRLRALTPEACLLQVADRTEAVAVLAGVLLLNDLLDDSHGQSQSIEGEGRGNGDYWHAIMHRREPDFGNAKYWFRRVGDHPAMGGLPTVAEGIAADISSDAVSAWLPRLQRRGWDSFAFVDLCSELDADRNPPAPLLEFAERLQWAEMLLLLAHSCRNATG